MNFKIKKLMEALFDDSDDDFLSKDNQISTKLVNDEILKLREINNNWTKYSDKLTDYDAAKSMAELGTLITDRVRKISYASSLNLFVYKCSFKQLEETLNYDRITVILYSPNMPKDRQEKKLFDVYVTENHIHYIIFNNYDNDLYEVGDNNLRFSFMDLIDYLYDNNYKIDEVILTYIPDKTKTIVLLSKKLNTIITSDHIDNIPKITSMTNTNIVSLYSVTKNAKIILGYSLCFDTAETFLKFLLLWKNMGYKKFEMMSNVYIDDDYSVSEKIFSKFVIGNNLERYSFTLKDDIKNIAVDKTINYCEEKYGYDHNKQSMLYSTLFGTKGKDKEHGEYVMLLVKCEFQDTVANKYRHIKINWKFYKSGLTIFVSEE